MIRKLCAALLLSFVLLASPHSHQHRSQAARREFKREHPCPATGEPKGPCPGYVLDHIEPLACGGADAASNLQWQTVEAGKEKDKWERRDCW